MTTPTPDLDLVRSHDPAADIHPDPDSPTGQAILARATTDQGGDITHTGTSGTRPAPRRVLVAVATLSIVTGAAAVAKVGPFANEWEACHEAPSEAGRNVPFPECAEFVSERVLAEAEADGSEFERRVLADGVVTRAEYDEAAQRTAACIQDALDEVGATGATASAAESEWQLGFRYGFQISYPADFDRSTLPWAEDDSTTGPTGDDDDNTVQPATRITDEMVQGDPMMRCPAEHYNRIDRLWEAQQIAAQDD